MVNTFFNSPMREKSLMSKLLLEVLFVGMASVLEEFYSCKIQNRVISSIVRFNKT